MCKESQAKAGRQEYKDRELAECQEHQEYPAAQEVSQVVAESPGFKAKVAYQALASMAHYRA